MAAQCTRATRSRVIAFASGHNKAGPCITANKTPFETLEDFLLYVTATFAVRGNGLTMPPAFRNAYAVQEVVDFARERPLLRNFSATFVISHAEAATVRYYLNLFKQLHVSKAPYPERAADCFKAILKNNKAHESAFSAASHGTRFMALTFRNVSLFLHYMFEGLVRLEECTVQKKLNEMHLPTTTKQFLASL